MDNLQEAVSHALTHYDNVVFSRGAKRMSVDGDRDWHLRYSWQASDSQRHQECEWEGFATPEEAQQDFIHFANQLKR